MTANSSTLQTADGFAPTTEQSDAVFSKINWRLIPLLLVAYVVAYLDRVNIGYAQLQMKQTLPWDVAVYGLGAGIFFVGYFLFEVPSNLMLERIGARKTLLRIMVCWGLVAAGMMFVTTPLQFYVMRFLLGAFEAGFFPGLILYFTYWYPSARRGRVVAITMTATAIGGILAGPMSGAILKYMDGVNGWHGWQWMFLVQGLPAVVLGIVIYILLDDRPADAKWLTPEEKAQVQHALDHDEKDIVAEQGHSLGHMLRDFRVYLLALVYFLILAANYTMVFWLPTLIQSWGVKDVMTIGLYTMIPYAAGAIGMVIIGRSSDKFRERRWHFAATVTIAAVGLLITTMLQGNLTGSIIALSIALVGVGSSAPVLFTLVSEYMSAAAAAAGIALISSLGNLGAAVAPYINTLVLQRTGDANYSMYLVVFLYLSAGVVLLLSVRPAKAIST